MTTQDVTIVMPSRGDKRAAYSVLEQVTHRPFILVVDDVWDAPMNLRKARIVLSPLSKCGPVVPVEAGIVAAQTSHVAIIVDDVEFPDGGQAWLEEACETYRKEIGDRDGVVALNDGIRSDIACLPLIAREFYMKHIYPTPFRKYFADTELSVKAQALGVYAVAHKARVTHLNTGPQDVAAHLRELPIYEQRMKVFRNSLA